jgi:hypothetical protein
VRYREGLAGKLQRLLRERKIALLPQEFQLLVITIAVLANKSQPRSEILRQDQSLWTVVEKREVGVENA